MPKPPNWEDKQLFVLSQWTWADRNPLSTLTAMVFHSWCIVLVIVLLFFLDISTSHVQLFQSTTSVWPQVNFIMCKFIAEWTLGPLMDSLQYYLDRSNIPPWARLLAKVERGKTFSLKKPRLSKPAFWECSVPVGWWLLLGLCDMILRFSNSVLDFTRSQYMLDQLQSFNFFFCIFLYI